MKGIFFFFALFYYTLVSPCEGVYVSNEVTMITHILTVTVELVICSRVATLHQ